MNPIHCFYSEFKTDHSRFAPVRPTAKFCSGFAPVRPTADGRKRGNGQKALFKSIALAFQATTNQVNGKTRYRETSTAATGPAADEDIADKDKSKNNDKVSGTIAGDAVDKESRVYATPSPSKNAGPT